MKYELWTANVSMDCEVRNVKYEQELWNRKYELYSRELNREVGTVNK